jgi:hypothetical protein
MFNLAIDSKLRGCDAVAVRVDDVAPNGYTLDRATVRQKKLVARSGSNSPAAPPQQPNQMVRWLCMGLGRP